MLHHHSFYSHSEYKSVSSGLIPSFSVSLCPRLSFISTRLLSSPQMAATPPKKNRSSTLCCVQGRRDEPRQLFWNVSSCFATLKMQMCTLGSEGAESRLLLRNTKGIILEMSEQMSALTCGFYVRRVVCLSEAAEIRAHLQFFAVLSFY